MMKSYFRCAVVPLLLLTTFPLMALPGDGLSSSSSLNHPQNPEKLFEEGVAFLKGTAGASDPSSAFLCFQQSADLANPRAMNAIASMFASGNGTPQNYGKASEWYDKAATLGEPRAMYNLGRLEELGLGRPSNKPKALEWYLKADAAGMAQASLKLGDFYYFGYPSEGIPKDMGLAYRFFRKGADLGFSEAQNQIGVMMEEGFGCQADPVQAAEWFRKSAGQGFARAQNNLGRIYATGHGIPKDEEKAVLWFSYAELNGDQNAPIVLDEYSKSMSTKVVAAAKKKFRQYVDKGLKQPPD